MAVLAWTLLMVLTALPAGLQVEVVRTAFSELTHGLSNLNPLSQDPEHAVNEDEDDMEDTNAPLSEEEVAMWHDVLHEVVQDIDQLDDTLFEEEGVATRTDIPKTLDFQGLPKSFYTVLAGEEIALRTGIPETVDCYGLPGPISRVLRFLFRTDRKETVNTRYFLSTRKQRDRVELKYDPDFDLSATDFDPGRGKTAFIVHGFMSNSEMQWVRNLSDAILDAMDANVIAVDWSGGGGSWMYWRAVANTRVTGSEITKLITKMMEAGLKRKSIHLIGHSLGAHICSYTASHLGGVARITGLDPAQPCFQADSPDVRLDLDDAEFIDVIHTNGRGLVKVGLGLPQPIGHVDFYPNGGAKQPGCSKKTSKVLFPVINFIKNRIEKSICSHGRSYMFFTESIKKADECFFWGHRWDRNERNTIAAVIAPCNADNCTAMGIEADIFPARGSFYVATQDKSPYCIQDPRTDNEMVPFLSELYTRMGHTDEK